MKKPRIAPKDFWCFHKAFPCIPAPCWQTANEKEPFEQIEVVAYGPIHAKCVAGLAQIDNAAVDLMRSKSKD